MKEALKLALEALEYWDVHGGLHQPTEEAITALRLAIDVQNMASESTYKAALAQPAQEPTGMLHIDRLDKWLDASLKERKSQRTWVGLTDEEFQYCVELKNSEAIVEEVEAKLKEKNT